MQTLARKHYRPGFTLVELLVVMSIMLVLMGMLLPALGKARKQARTVLGATYQSRIAEGAIQYTLDNRDRFPESVATIGFGGFWHWQDPRMMIAYEKRAPQLHRAMSEYLIDYIPEAKTMYSPHAPGFLSLLPAAWKAGDAWDHPDTPIPWDPFMGTYCFYWNYTGFLGWNKLFLGPRRISGGSGQSKILSSDYFGYDHWRSLGAFSSSNRFDETHAVQETCLSSSYWASRGGENCWRQNPLGMTLQASYIDGHVGSYCDSDVIAMKVSKTSDGSIPYPSGIGPGIFYLPKNHRD